MYEEELAMMFDDTSRLVAGKKAEMLNAAATAYKNSSSLISNVEFWDWMNRNYSSANGHMFSSNQAMKDYISQGQGKVDWMFKQLQGKGYDYRQSDSVSDESIYK